MRILAKYYLDAERFLSSHKLMIFFVGALLILWMTLGVRAFLRTLREARASGENHEVTLRQYALAFLFASAMGPFMLFVLRRDLREFSWKNKMKASLDRYPLAREGGDLREISPAQAKALSRLVREKKGLWRLRFEAEGVVAVFFSGESFILGFEGSVKAVAPCVVPHC